MSEQYQVAEVLMTYADWFFDVPHPSLPEYTASIKGSSGSMEALNGFGKVNRDNMAPMSGATAAPARKKNEEVGVSCDVLDDTAVVQTVRMTPSMTSQEVTAILTDGATTKSLHEVLMNGSLERQLDQNESPLEIIQSWGKVVNMNLQKLVIKPRASLPPRPSVMGATGWLHKEGGKMKSWKKRWFVTNKEGILYYKDQKMNGQPLGNFPFKNMAIFRVLDTKRGTTPYTFCVRVHNDKSGIKGEVGGALRFLCAESADEMNKWVQVLHAFVSTDKGEEHQ